MTKEGGKSGVGLVGCGSIGGDIARAVRAGEVAGARLVALFDQDEGRGRGLAAELGGKVPYFGDLAGFLGAEGLELVVECASAAAVRGCAEAVVASGKDLVVMSTGALLDEGLLERLEGVAREKGRLLLMPSGAIGGLDAIRAAAHSLEEVTLTSTKPPRGLSGSAGFKEWEGVEITEPTVIFEGPALEAVKLFPANVNVAASLSLAGLGPHRTQVKVVADPDAPGNVHEITAKGGFVIMQLRFENQPHPDNPRTSYLAVLSAIELLRQACGRGTRVES